MNINRHNYESFFLLLVDGELNAQQQEEVMMFVDTNPDLAVELEALYATKLPVDEPVFFPNKQSLIKEAGTSISLANYEEWFCRYIDKELTQAEVAAVELFVLQHPTLQSDFLLMQETVLPVEAIFFENKEILYRKEAKRVVFIPYLRQFAVAAALLMVVFSVWFVTRNSNVDTNNALVNNTTNPINNGSIINGDKPSSINTQKNNQVTVTENNLARSTNATTNKQEVLVKKDAINLQQSQALAQVSLPKNTVEENVVTTASSTNTTALPVVEKQIETNTAKVEVEPLEEEPQRVVEKVSYKELDTDENGKSLYVGAIEINKDKLRGFLRKAGSIFKSKAKQEEDKTDTSPQRLK
jgi:hypothetical protein